MLCVTNAAIDDALLMLEAPSSVSMIMSMLVLTISRSVRAPRRKKRVTKAPVSGAGSSCSSAATCCSSSPTTGLRFFDFLVFLRVLVGFGGGASQSSGSSSSPTSSLVRSGTWLRDFIGTRIANRTHTRAPRSAGGARSGGGGYREGCAFSRICSRRGELAFRSVAQAQSQHGLLLLPGRTAGEDQFEGRKGACSRVSCSATSTRRRRISLPSA